MPASEQHALNWQVRLAAMPDQEDPLAEQRVPADIAEVLQQDPADEAQVEAGQQEQVSGPRRPAHREMPTSYGTAT